jgi:hypothetical protein
MERLLRLASRALPAGGWSFLVRRAAPAGSAGPAAGRGGIMAACRSGRLETGLRSSGDRLDFALLVGVGAGSARRASAVVSALSAKGRYAVAEANGPTAPPPAGCRRPGGSRMPRWCAMLAALGRGIVADRAAVHAALTEPWSSGPTEGHITRLKLIRCQMHGRGKLDLLRARLVAPGRMSRKASPLGKADHACGNRCRRDVSAQRCGRAVQRDLAALDDICRVHQ